MYMYIKKWRRCVLNFLTPICRGRFGKPRLLHASASLIERRLKSGSYPSRFYRFMYFTWTRHKTCVFYTLHSFLWTLFNNLLGHDSTASPRCLIQHSVFSGIKACAPYHVAFVCHVDKKYRQTDPSQSSYWPPRLHEASTQILTSLNSQCQPSLLRMLQYILEVVMSKIGPV